jgi:exopolysaccharide biosynthesis polyprenyl glycosylphosphotransferase
LLFADALGCIVLFWVVGIGDLGVGGGGPPLGLALPAAAGVALLSLGALGAYGQASRRPGRRLATAFELILLASAMSLLAAVAGGGIGSAIEARRLVVAASLVSFVWISARCVASVADRRHPQRAVVVGTGVTATSVWELTLRHPECGLRVVGFVDDKPLELPLAAPEILGRIVDLPRIVREHTVDAVVVAYANRVDGDLVSLLRALDDDVSVVVVPRLFELVRAHGFELGRLAVLDAGGLPRGRGEWLLKRAVDIVSASIALILLLPVAAVIAVAIKVDSPGPVFFRQRRVGRSGEWFDVLKFRTMTDGAEDDAFRVVDGLAIEDAVHQLKLRSVEMHVTRVGELLRRTSLDELPQLWNVLVGDMSLVGPRPLRAYEVEALSPEQAATRHSVRPGITGTWQVSGRSSVGWDERVQLDCLYARHWSLTADLRILARTIGAVIRGGDAV